MWARLQPLLFDLAVTLPPAVVVLLLLWWGGCLSPRALERAPRRRTGLTGVDLLLALALLALGMVVMGLVARPLGLMPASGKLTPVQETALALLSQACVFVPLVVFTIWRAGQVPGGRRALGLVSRRPGRDALLALGGLIVGLVLVQATATLTEMVGVLCGQKAPVLGHDLLKVLVEAPSWHVRAALIVSAVVVAPLVEETVFRGLVQSALLTARGPHRRWSIVMMAALLFGLAHASGAIWQALPGLVVLGMVLGWLYERTASLLPGMLVHAGFNLVNIALALWTVHPVVPKH